MSVSSPKIQADGCGCGATLRGDGKHSTGCAAYVARTTQARWTIYKRTGEWDDVIEGPDTIEEGVPVVAEAEVHLLREVCAWLLPYATYPECICEKGTIGSCDCNVSEAQRNYHSTLAKAQAILHG